MQLGQYVVHGENVVLTGELDLEREELPQHITRVSEAEITEGTESREGGCSSSMIHQKKVGISRF